MKPRRTALKEAHLKKEEEQLILRTQNFEAKSKFLQSEFHSHQEKLKRTEEEEVTPGLEKVFYSL
jgi:hypothetical protein